MKMKINKKRFIPIVLLAVVIIILIVVIINVAGKEHNEESGNFSLDNVELSNVDRISSDVVTYQEDTKTNSENLDAEGNMYTEEQIATFKEDIKQKMKTYSKEKLGLEIEISEASIIFNAGITNVNGNDCLVFNVYGGDGEYMKFYGKYAMSVDYSTLYFFNSDYLAFILIK